MINDVRMIKGWLNWSIDDDGVMIDSEDVIIFIDRMVVIIMDDAKIHQFLVFLDIHRITILSIIR